MSRCKSLIALVAIVLVASALAAVTIPQKAEAASLKARLRHAKLALRHSKARLHAAQAALAAAAVAADPLVTQGGTDDPTATPSPTPCPTPSPTATVTPSVTVDELQAKVVKARRSVRVWRLRVQRLAKKYNHQRKMARWERRGQWMPIIRVAAAKYHVSATGMYRMMMRESGGQRYAGANSAFKGLFQYWTGTWKASWNPWRHDSIYDGSSQIFATAYAIHKGMGPRMWTTTFRSQY